MKRDYLARQGLHHHELAQAIAGRSQTDPAFLTTAYEKPFPSAKYFGNRMKKRCQEAGLMDCASTGSGTSRPRAYARCLRRTVRRCFLNVTDRFRGKCRHGDHHAVDADQRPLRVTCRHFGGHQVRAGQRC